MTSKPYLGIRKFLIIALWLAGIWAGRKGGGGDFEVLWRTVGSAWSGNWDQVYLRESSGPFFYPPIALLVFGFFAWIPNWNSAVVANLIFHSVCYFGFWLGFDKLFSSLKTLPFWLWLLPFGVAIAPMHLDFMGQNIELPLMAGLVAVELASRGSGKSRFWAGFASGIISLLKLFPLLVSVTYFFRRDRKISLGLVTGWLVGATAPLLVFGVDNGLYLTGEFFETLRIYHDKNLLTLNPGVLNLPALIATWFGPWVSIAVRDALLLLIPAAVGIGFYVSIFRKRLGPPESVGVWALAVALMAFLNSSSRPDYFVFFVPAFAYLSSHWNTLQKAERVQLLLAFLLIAGTQQAVVSKPVNIQLEFWRLPVVGMALLCWSARKLLSLRVRN